MSHHHPLINKMPHHYPITIITFKYHANMLYLYSFYNLRAFQIQTCEIIVQHNSHNVSMYIFIMFHNIIYTYIVHPHLVSA
uniref:Uncharacterized protein n=1 Tax=Oryza glaberrima TaxID=4538 RepID=I1R7V8_ORYGL